MIAEARDAAIRPSLAAPPPRLGFTACRWCGGTNRAIRRGVATKSGARSATLCDACVRHRERLRARGLTDETPCCRAMPLPSRGRGELYCPACPGLSRRGEALATERVGVVLVGPGGRERLAFHPRDAIVGGFRPIGTLERLAALRRIDVEDMVLYVSCLRDWHLGRLWSARLR